MKVEINFIDCNKELPTKKNPIGVIKTLIYCENGRISEAVYIGNKQWVGSLGLKYGVAIEMGEGSRVTHWAYQKTVNPSIK